MHLVGYIRESGDPSEDAPAFAQHEELRRHASVEGHHLVAVCSDTREAGREPDREGYRSLLGVIASGSVDGVLVPGLDTLSSDTIVQEIMLWDLRSRGIAVLSTRADDLDALDPAAVSPSRLFIRDVLTRVAEHGAFIRETGMRPSSPAASEAVDDNDVVVHLIRQERAAVDPDHEAGSAAVGNVEG
ncbi:MAG TPA: recombinase family protein [Acidimicrobiia bacterium]|nr:recombinase family protein [Acidimicrobiia bacterium]